MKNIITSKLKEIEKTYGVQILYACGSGSRAWGFSSPDSDYDVRFIYVHPKEFYLNIEEQRDVIELPVDAVLDINGWELRKALRLFRKSNGPLFEWLQSPIVYQQHDDFHAALMELIPAHFSMRATMHHYMSMAKSVFQVELAGDDVRLKKYFYVLRPLLACRWIADRKEVPPMLFGKLREIMDDSVNTIVDELLKVKSQRDENYAMKPIAALHDYIQEQIAYCEKAVPDMALINDSDVLNQLFRKYVV